MGFINKDLLVKTMNNVFLLLYVLLFIIFACLFSMKNMNQLNTYLYIIYCIIIGGVVLFALSIIYYFFKTKIEKIKGALSYIGKFIFYFPKIINETIEYLTQQYHLTPNRLIWLFFIEIIFIFSYFAFSYFVEKKTNQKGKHLLRESIFLREKTTIANNDDLFPILPNNDNDKTQRRNYSFSLWVYLNQQNETNNKTIFSYGSQTNMKPKILYLKKSKDDGNIIRIYFTSMDDDLKTYFDFELPCQKWNNIVVNYDNNVCDLFVNGHLLKTFVYSDRFPLYEKSDLVEIGDEGLNGAICNVAYYKIPLTNSEIVNLYHLLHQNNPPSL